MDEHRAFQQRLRRVNTRHKALAKGYTTYVGTDGLIIVRPKPHRARTRRLRIALFAVAGVFVFKTLTFAALGEQTYDDRVARLAQGTGLEQAGSWIMQSDPVTEFLAGFLGDHLKPSQIRL